MESLPALRVDTDGPPRLFDLLQVTGMYRKPVHAAAVARTAQGILPFRFHAASYFQFCVHLICWKNKSATSRRYQENPDHW